MSSLIGSEKSSERSIRWQRMEERIRKEVAILIFDRQQKDDSLGFVSVTKIRLAKDYAVLKVWVSLFAKDEDGNERTLESLIAHCKHFQSRLSSNLRLRATPRILFERDQSISKGDQIIEKIINESPTATSDRV